MSPIRRSPLRRRARSWRFRRLAILSLVSAAVFAARLPAQSDPDAPAEPEASPSAAGDAIFVKHCFECHLVAGRPANPDSVPFVRRIRRADYSFEELEAIIRLGVTHMGMPPFEGVLNEEEIAAVAQFLSSANADGAAGAPLSPEAEKARHGESLFFGKARCYDCHTVGNLGGFIAPNLTFVADRLNREQITEALRSPVSRITPGFELKRITTKDGEQIQGLYRNETRETIQLYDPEQTLWTTYFKRDLSRVETLKETYMPPEPFASLSPDEQEALIFFLLTLTSGDEGPEAAAP
jgi:putative heme-binding domain-containing protein